ncbi:TPA: hypothetical protein H1016_05500 [archaeon]|uniref:CARDB domain-containing protein n=1 Tax=Candidatus Naiadarchaeum limnaeum TaxID=2756139 RepID=A0A832V2T7_9ARCH|nr:hypothetical protein [Candidatus Naiadarchaeum limnaeum]
MRPKLSLLIFAIFLVFTPIVSAQVLPDLIVDTIAVSNTNPKSGEMISINVEIKNNGTNTSPLFPYDLYVIDEKFGERKIETNWNYNKLGVGKIYKTTLKATIFGPSTIRIVVDIGNVVPELNNDNNEKSVKIGFVEPVKQPKSAPPAPQPVAPPKQKNFIQQIPSFLKNTTSPFRIAVVAGAIIVIIVTTYLLFMKKTYVEEST